MAELLTGIEITGYRQFERFRMDGLRRVNLLVGKNNAGKTALLEAVQILTTRPALGAIWQILDRRGETAREGEIYGERNSVPVSLRHLFPGHRHLVPGDTLSIRSAGGDRQVLLAVNKNLEGLESSPLSGFISRSSDLALSLIEDGLHSAYSSISSGGVLSRSPAFKREQVEGRFVPASGLEPERMADFYNRSLERGTEGTIIDALRLLDPSVTDVSFLAGFDFNVRKAGEGILIGYDRRNRNPLGSAGEGMERMLGLALALSNARGGTLLIDEIDTGLHHSVMGDLWRLVTKTAQRLDIQVFATTHSLDCVRGIVAMGQEDPSLFEEIAVHTIDARRGQSVATAGERLDDAVQLEVELR